MGWMAWTQPTAIFFIEIAYLLVIFTFLGIRYPEMSRHCILTIEKTHGDRPFITLLGSAFINAGWLALSGLPQRWA